MVSAFKNRGDGGEEEVEVAVDDGHEGGHGEDDGGEEEEFGGADDGAFEEVAGGEARVEFGDEGSVASFPAETAGFAGEEGGWVSFAQEVEGRNADGAGLG